MSDENPQNTAEDLPEETIIIVGVVCGSIVIILTIVLIVLCCKRQQTKQQYEKQQESHTSIAMGADPSSDSTEGVKPALKSGLDNPGLDQTDSSPSALDRSHEGPFVTNTSAHPHDMPYDGRIGPEAHGNHWNIHQNNTDHAPPAYPNTYNMAKDVSGREHHPNEPQQKSKKVIYEVVV